MRPSDNRFIALWTRNSDSASRELVASSNSSIGAFRSIARAMAIRCRSPPDKVVPLSPTTVSYPSGRLIIKSCAAAIFATCCILSKSAEKSPKRLLSAIDKLNKVMSWLTIEI